MSRSSFGEVLPRLWPFPRHSPGGPGAPHSIVPPEIPVNPAVKLYVPHAAERINGETGSTIARRRRLDRA
jgi:hypothetical protein